MVGGEQEGGSSLLLAARPALRLGPNKDLMAILY